MTTTVGSWTARTHSWRPWRSGRPRPTSIALFEASADAVLRHFTRDEDCAVRARCPAVEMNGEAHAEVIAILARFRLSYERSGAAPESAAELEREIGAWVARYLPGPFGDRLPCIPLG